MTDEPQAKLTDHIAASIGGWLAQYHQVLKENEWLKGRVAELEDHIQQTTPETVRVCLTCGATEDLEQWMEFPALKGYELNRRHIAILAWYCPRHQPTGEKTP